MIKIFVGAFTLLVAVSVFAVLATTLIHPDAGPSTPVSDASGECALHMQLSEAAVIREHLFAH